jgi:aminotransferase
MRELSYRIDEIKQSKIEDSLKVLEQRPDIISLGAGEPDFSTPPNIVKAAKEALDKGYTHYSPYGGRKELREAIAEKLKKENKIDVDPDEIMVSCGSKESILLFMSAIVNPGDEVIVPNPGYLGYAPIARFLGANVVSLKLSEEDNFEINVDELKKLVNKKTKIIVINSPSNPTGCLIKRKTLEEIADVAIENDLFIMSDEAYEKIIYDGEKHVSIGSLNGMKDYVITLQTFSKAYAMCGFRIGYGAANKKLVEQVKKLKLCTTICAPVPSQFAAIEALKGKESKKYVNKMVKEYDRRRKFLIKRLKEMPNIHCIKPKGAFYAFPNISGLSMNSEEASKFFLENAKVLTIPGIEFGNNGDNYLRISYATKYEKIVEAMNRMEKALNAFKL